MNRVFLVAGLLLCAYSTARADPVNDSYAQGPLTGKNLYLPYLIHYTFPSLPARSGNQYDLSYHVSLYYVQDFCDANPFQTGKRRIYDKSNIVRDYESAVGELGVAFNPLKNLQTGMDMRIFSYYAGGMDSFVEGFHRIFGFPSGDREYFLRNQLYVNIKNDQGIPFFLDRSTVSFGDMDLWGKWTFFENPLLSFALLGALKLPTGKLAALSGSGCSDTALGVLSDIRLKPFLSLYVQAGLVQPFNMKSRTMFNGLVGLEIHPWDFLSFNIQMNIKTSPISNRSQHIYWDFSLPQTNLLLGFAVRHKGFRWQFYLEEDAITHQGTDITFNLMFSHTLPAETFRKLWSRGR